MPMTASEAKRHQVLLANRVTQRSIQPESKQTVPAFISDTETYRPSEIKRRVGLGRDWLRGAVRNGLTVIKEGGKIFIDGEALRKYLNRPKASVVTTDEPAM